MLRSSNSKYYYCPNLQFVCSKYFYRCCYSCPEQETCNLEVRCVRKDSDWCPPKFALSSLEELIIEVL